MQVLVHSVRWRRVLHLTGARVTLDVTFLEEDPSKAVREPGKNTDMKFAGYSNVLGKTLCYLKAALFFFSKSNPQLKCKKVETAIYICFCVAAKWTAWRFLLWPSLWVSKSITLISEFRELLPRL